MPVYRLWMSRPTEAWYQLSEADQQEQTAKSRAALAQVGGKTLIMCTPMWSNEEWGLFGVEEFPSVKAIQEHTQLLFDMGHMRYVQGKSMLGIEYPLE